jgi:hypothetical protein
MNSHRFVPYTRDFGPGYPQQVKHTRDYLEGVSGRLLAYAISLAYSSVWRRNHPSPQTPGDFFNLVSALEGCGDPRAEAVARLSREIDEMQAALFETEKP